METTSVPDKVLRPGVELIDCPIGRFQHKIALPLSNRSCVLDLASPLYGHSSKSKVYDRSPYANHGAITGAIWERLPSGLWVLSFDGGDDVVTMPDIATYNLTTALTAEVWVRTGTINQDQQYIFAKYAAAGNNREWAILTDTSAQLGYIRLILGDPADGTSEVTLISAEKVFADTATWYHLAITFAPNTLLFYVNGALTETVVSSGAAPALLFNGSPDVELGRRTGGDYFHGYITRARLHNRVLSVAELWEHFDQEKHLFGGL